MTGATRKNAATAWLIAATLDIIYAAVTWMIQGKTAGDMLRFVASGPFGDAAKGWGVGGAALGLATHFALMAVMVALFVLLLRWVPMLANWPWWLTGGLYGVAIYLVMYGLVLTSRFGAPFPPADLTKFTLGLFPHIFFIGLPMAWLLARRRGEA